MGSEGHGGVGESTGTSVSLPLERSSNATATVTLIRPPVVVPVESFAYVAQMPPLGLAYIAGALREAGHEIHVIDAPGESPTQVTDRRTSHGAMLRRIGLSFEEILDRIPVTSQVIGITHMFLHEWPTVRELADVVKRRFPDATLVLGGENATSFRTWILEESAAIDCVVMGEGETTVVELVGRIAAGASLEGMRGIALREADRESLERNGQLPVRIRALTTIPRPAWDLFPMENYFQFIDDISVAPSRSIPMLATRGCPYKCSFCSSPQMWTTRYSVREPSDIVDEIEDYVRRYGIDSIDFVDLTAMTKRKWMLAFCDELEGRKLGTEWHLPVGTRSEGFDDHVLQRLHDAGCRSITLAPEHGSQHMLEVFDKRLDLDQIFASIRAAKKAGLETHLNTIIGHPAERWADRGHHLVFLIRSAWAGCTTASAFVFHPYPGSRDFEELLAAGQITVDDEFIYDGVFNVAKGNRSWNPTLTPVTLYWTQVVMKATFELVAMVRRPQRAWRLFRAIFAKDVHTYTADVHVSADTDGEAAGPVGMRLGDEHDTEVVALWVRSLVRRNGKGARRAAPDAEGSVLTLERPDVAEPTPP